MAADLFLGEIEEIWVAIAFEFIELIIVELQIHSQLFTIASFYRPHKRDNATMAKFHSVLSHLRPQNFSNLVVCGDFNIDPTDPSDTDNSILLQIQNEFCL